MKMFLACAASVIIALWGIAHIVPTKGIVKGFRGTTFDNTMIITMEWIAEGLTLIFIGLLCMVIVLKTGLISPATNIVYKLSAGMLFSLAILSIFTGARVKLLPMQLCPVVKSACAVMLLIAVS